MAGDGQVAIAAPQQLKLTEGVLVAPNTVKIERDIEVKGKVDVT
jgi:hypothetical protein